MASGLRGWLRDGACLSACLLLSGWATVVEAQYRPGQQHVFPFYYPEDQAWASNPGLSYNTPVIITGLSGGRYDAANCIPNSLYPTPIGYKTPYDCQAIESSQVLVAGHSFRVHQDIKDNTEALFSALNEHLAANNETPATAWGWRSFSTQVGLRVTNGCPDIWLARSSSCKKAHTARPGGSNHEQGYAIDIYHRGGGSITNTAFRWLQNNAAGFGFYNLPSEPWHWSINGR